LLVGTTMPQKEPVSRHWVGRGVGTNVGAGVGKVVGWYAIEMLMGEKSITVLLVASKKASVQKRERG